MKSKCEFKMKLDRYLRVSVFLVYGFIEVLGFLQDCPLGWDQYGPRCFKFVFYPIRSYFEAHRSCQEDGALLIGLNTKGENQFVIGWLNKHEKHKANKWWTGGRDEIGEIMWFGTGPFLAPASGLWVDNKAPAVDSTKAIVYQYDVVESSFKWNKEKVSTKLPYICEVALSEAYRIVQQQRDFSYGTDTLDPKLIPKGPKFIVQPPTITVVGDVRDIFLECEASSFPHASYKWYRVLKSGEIADIDDTQDRYSITNGKLTFHEPSISLDTGEFRCIATNSMGSAISEPGGLNFGFLAEFSNDGGGDAKAILYRGTYLDCGPPMHNPAVDIQWYKEAGGPMFLRTDLHPYQYTSFNGRLYFSEVTGMDAGIYHCVATLIASSGERLSTSQNPSRTSMGVELIVQGGSPSDYGPAIHKDFPFVSPSPPLHSQTLILECFAYGKPPLYYSWTKDGGPVPQKSKLADHGRKLYLPDAQLEDSGNYTCRVQRGNSAKTRKTLLLQIEAAPFFLTPMRDKHVDVDDKVVWLCNAYAIPEPTYVWYKNAVPLTTTADGITVQKNRLTIDKANKDKHEGMYQCEARNKYGVSIETVQLRVLAFSPSFAKNPIEASLVGTLGGSVTILCRPEGSPRPRIEWQKGGFDLSFTDSPSSRIQLLPNGNLLITESQMSDEGPYDCIATNDLGSARSGGRLTLVEKTVLFHSPVDDRVTVNGSIFMFCQASYDVRFQDLVYVWDVNGKVIDVDNDNHFQRGTRNGVPGLYLVHAQMNHTGVYTCTATTVYEKTSRSAFLQVQGPPGECAGVVGEVLDRNMTLRWLIGASHGSSVTKFHVQFHTNFNRDWRDLHRNVLLSRIMERSDVSRCLMTVGDLKPGSMYAFRVIAVNRFGSGPPSRPSPLYKIADAPPMVTVQNVAEGVGPVGTLPIVWEELSEEDLTGSGVGYQIFYRRKTRTQTLWSTGEVKGRTNSFTAVVGVDNFYLEYEVMVGVFNHLGPGPNSSVYVLMSAEDVPIGTPSNVFGDSVNATAIMAYWNPIPDTRAFVRGRILGYQVNYWSQNLEDPEVGSTSIYCSDNCGEGLVVALDPNEDYWFTVQVFTLAGMGPPSESGEGSTYIFAPLHYPEFVGVSSHPGKAVSVHWRGVPTGLLEEAVTGYKMRWWPASDNILTATDTVVEGKRTYGVITGLKEGTVYALRVLGFSPAGDGKKSPTIYFTMEGQVVVNPETTAFTNTAGKDYVATVFITLSFFVSLHNLFYATSLKF